MFCAHHLRPVRLRAEARIDPLDERISAHPIANVGVLNCKTTCPPSRQFRTRAMNFINWCRPSDFLIRSERARISCVVQQWIQDETAMRLCSRSERWLSIARGGPFIDTEHRGMLRRIDLKPGHIGGLTLEVWIIRGHVALQPIGLKPSALPDPRNRGTEVAASPSFSQLLKISGFRVRIHARQRRNRIVASLFDNRSERSGGIRKTARKAAAMSPTSFSFRLSPSRTMYQAAHIAGMSPPPANQTRQSLDSLDPVLPLSPWRAERHGFGYYRHGTLSLYAARNTTSGKVLVRPLPAIPRMSLWPFWARLSRATQGSRDPHHRRQPLGPYDRARRAVPGRSRSRKRFLALRVW
jgi:hypothetical protein